MDDEAGRKYASQYEDQLDPFMKFSRNEKLRKYTSLSAHDKITLNMGKFILRKVLVSFFNRSSRLQVFKCEGTRVIRYLRDFCQMHALDA